MMYQENHKGQRFHLVFQKSWNAMAHISKLSMDGGTPSIAPYMNWRVVSIYYLSNNGNVIMGIEEDRYPCLKEMPIKSLRNDKIGNKKVNTAVFCSATENSVNYSDFYECFMSGCKEVMKLGLR